MKYLLILIFPTIALAQFGSIGFSGNSFGSHPLGFNSQTGTTPVFSPMDIVGLVRWLRSDSVYSDAAMTTLQTSNGGAIAGWKDKSGNGNNITQGTESKQPSLQTGIVNGLPVVRFDGGSDYLDGANIQDASKTFFIVGVKRSAPTAAWKTLFSMGATSQVLCNSTYTTALIYYLEDPATIKDIGGTPTSWKVTTIKWTSLSSLTVYENSTETASSDPNSDYSTNPTLTIGASEGGSNYGDYDVAEILEYNSALDDTDRGNVITYLTTRYGL